MIPKLVILIDVQARLSAVHIYIGTHAMLIKKLVTILASPVAPSDSGKGMKWPLIEDGLPFPSDYIEFINEYGSGRIADFIIIFNPFSKNEDVNFFEQYKFILEGLTYLIESNKDYYNYQLYPKDNGFIPLGVTDKVIIYSGSQILEIIVSYGLLLSSQQDHQKLSILMVG